MRGPLRFASIGQGAANAKRRSGYKIAAMHRHDATYVVEVAVRVFGDREKAAKWLDRPSLQLGGRAPRELLANDDGARRVEELLAQIDDDDRLHAGATRL